MKMKTAYPEFTPWKISDYIYFTRKKLAVFFIALFFLVACSEPEQTQSPAYTPPVSEATRLADQQLAGYNNRDMEAFLIPYSDSVRVLYN